MQHASRRMDDLAGMHMLRRPVAVPDVRLAGQHMDSGLMRLVEMRLDGASGGLFWCALTSRPASRRSAVHLTHFY